MSKKIDELLAVLDMPEEEQRKQIAKYISPKPYKHKWQYGNAVGGIDNIATGDCWACEKCGHEEIFARKNSGQFIPAVLDKRAGECREPDPIADSLADLAFRLRDEAKTKHEKEWYQACFIISEKLFNPRGGREYKEYRGSEAEHYILGGKAIWWIIAALIAKELAGKELTNDS